MPKINFNSVDEPGSQSGLVPPGRYLCRVKDVVVGTTKKGDPYWNLHLVVEENGPFYGYMLFDNVVFSIKALTRAKMIFKRFGVDITQEREYGPDDLLNKYACVIVDGIEKYTDAEGTEKEKSVIGYAGYEEASGPPPTSKDATDDTPF